MGWGSRGSAQTDFAEDHVCYGAFGLRSVFLGEKDGQSFFLLPKDERSASLEGVQLSSVENKPLAELGRSGEEIPFGAWSLPRGRAGVCAEAMPEEGWAGTGIRETQSVRKLPCPRSLTMTKPSQSLCSPAGCTAEGHHDSGVAAIYILTPIIYLSIKPCPALKGKGFFLTAADFFYCFLKKKKKKK